METSSIKNQIWTWFLSINIAIPIFSFLFKISIFGWQHLGIFTTSLGLSTVLFLVELGLFWKLASPLANKLEQFKTHRVVEDKKQSNINYINQFPIRGSLIIGVYSILLPTISETINLWNGRLFSIEQFFFLWISDFAISTIAASFFFYRVKIILYPSINFLPYTPISLYNRILIPVLITTEFMVLISSAAVYYIGVTRHKDLMRQVMSLNIEEASLYLNTTLDKLLIQTDSYTKNEIVKGMNLPRVQEHLLELQKEKENFVESFFVSNMDGDTVNSLGKRFNVKKGKIFQSILKTEKFAISNPTKSFVDGSWILVCAVPIKQNKKLIGNFGMTFAIGTLGDALAKSSDEGKYDFIMLSEDGKVSFNKNYKYLNFDTQKELADSIEFSGLQNLHKLDISTYNKFNRDFLDIVFEKEKKYGMLIDMPKFNSRLLMFIPKSIFYKELNRTLIEICGFIIFVTFALIFVIRNISNNLTIPIKNTILTFERISNGDLTAETKDYVPDEFGEIIRYLGNLISVLRNTVSLIQSSSKALENTSVVLTTTTQNMAQSSQEQATSLQSSELIVKALYDAVEVVTNNSQNAYLSSKDTYSSMEELQSKVKEVKQITFQAQDLAKLTSQDATKGNELMKEAILGMERIDMSTKKIAETINVIGDISKQVNLIELNAAIEAARAGEYGKGFTVVADEISKLAERTSRNAKNIKDYIQEGILEVERGKKYVDNTGRSLSNIIQSIQKNTDLINRITDLATLQADFSEKVLVAVQNVMYMAEKISLSTQEQKISNGELTRSVAMISELTHALASGSEEIASTSLKISEQSKSLNQMIEFFKI